jgi:hypothetical protein
MTIYLDRNQVPAVLCGAYRGNKFRVEVTESVHIPSHAGLWDGGSRNTFRGVRLVDGAEVPLSDNMSAPWDAKRQDFTAKLAPGIAVVEHSTFCGKDMGLRIYVHPSDAAPMLPAPIELTAVERLVLDYTATHKASYMGKDRFAMALDDFRRDRDYGHCSSPIRAAVSRLDRPMWDAAKASLIARGMLNKAGAITTMGRNAINKG